MNVVEGAARRTIGQAYRHLGKWDEAEESLNLSRDILQGKAVKHELAQTLWQMALLYDDMSQRVPAGAAPANIKGPLEESVAIFQTLGIKFDLAKATEVRNHCSAASG